MRSSVLIREARQTITPRSAWTQWAFARDAQGKVTSYTGKDAVAWCPVGALLRTGQLTSDAVYWLNKCVNSLFSYWQDQEERTHDEVLSAMDNAASMAEQEGD